MTGRSPECEDRVVGETRSAGRVDVVWAEMRMRSLGSRRRVMAVSMRRGESGREGEKEKERGGGTAPTFIGPAARGEGSPRIEMSSPESGAPIGPDPSHGPPTLAGNRLTSFPARPSQTAAVFRSDPTT